jgi:hypothetical protein
MQFPSSLQPRCARCHTWNCCKCTSHLLRTVCLHGNPSAAREAHRQRLHVTCSIVWSAMHCSVLASAFAQHSTAYVHAPYEDVSEGEDETSHTGALNGSRFNSSTPMQVLVFTGRAVTR